MTLEGQGPEDTPAPPARTRWSGDAAEDDDVLLPPYVPGGQKPGGPPEAEDAEAPTEAPDGDVRGEPWDGGAEPDVGAPEPEDSWPGGTVEDDPWGAPEESQGGPWVVMDGYPEPGSGEEASTLEPEPEASTVEPEPAAPAGAGGSEFPWDPGPPAQAGEDDFPIDAFDLGGPPLEPVDAPDQPEPGFPSAPGSDEPRAVGDTWSAAERLERLADVLRQEGKTGVERELVSGDRLTSLLAGVIAGYLAGLDD